MVVKIQTGSIPAPTVIESHTAADPQTPDVDAPTVIMIHVLPLPLLENAVEILMIAATAGTEIDINIEKVEVEVETDMIEIITEMTNDTHDPPPTR